MGLGSSQEPKTLSTRAVFLLVFLFAIFVITCFSAKMIAFLSLIKLHHEIKTLDDILRSEYQIGTVKKVKKCISVFLTYYQCDKIFFALNSDQA